MPTVDTRVKVRRAQASREEPPPTSRRPLGIPWKFLILAALPVALGGCYLTLVAPSIVPVPATVNVPFPAATRFLEKICVWSGEHPWQTWGIGLALLIPGVLFRFAPARERYYLFLSIVLSLAVGFTYLSISAPIDRLLRQVESSLPEDHRVPEHHSTTGGSK